MLLNNGVIGYGSISISALAINVLFDSETVKQRVLGGNQKKYLFHPKFMAHDGLERSRSGISRRG